VSSLGEDAAGLARDPPGDLWFPAVERAGMLGKDDVDQRMLMSVVVVVVIVFIVVIIIIMVVVVVNRVATCRAAARQTQGVVGDVVQWGDLVVVRLGVLLGLVGLGGFGLGAQQLKRLLQVETVILATGVIEEIGEHRGDVQGRRRRQDGDFVVQRVQVAQDQRRRVVQAGDEVPAGGDARLLCE
jgi:hypothetical protein